jgi:hypothetical protein
MITLIIAAIYRFHFRYADFRHFADAIAAYAIFFIHCRHGHYC